MRQSTLVRLLMVVVFAWLAAPAEAQQYTASAAGDVKPIVAQAPQKPAELNEASGTTYAGFAVGASDVIRISVWKEPELSQTVTVRPDGYISMPLVGDVKVVGMTTNQIADLLTEKLSAYVVKPQVTLSVVEIRSREVYITGQVGKPGGYPLLGPMSVLQLIARAGGLSQFADRKGVFVLRQTGGGKERYSFNYKDVISGKRPEQDILLQPGDTVVVP